MTKFLLMKNNKFLIVDRHAYVEGLNVDTDWDFILTNNKSKATIFDENHPFLQVDFVKNKLASGDLIKVDINYKAFKTF